MRCLQALALTLALANAGDCLAQFGGPMGGMGGGLPRSGPGDRPRGAVTASGSHLLANLEQQLDNLRYELKLRPEQEPAWLDYQERVGALVADQLRPVPQESLGQASALRQIDRKIDVVRNRLAALEDIADAARRLYQRLDEKQQAIADRLLAATVPALYSGLGDVKPAGRNRSDEGGPEGRSPPPD